MRRLFKKDPPPGWQPGISDLDKAMQRFASTVRLPVKRGVVDAAAINRAALYAPLRSTASPSATANGPTHSAPWTAVDIEDAKRRIAADEEWRRLQGD